MRIKGNIAEAEVFTDVLDEGTREQIREMLNQSWARDAHMRIMPDVHIGKGATIGTTYYVRDRVVPSVVGVDIGCGVLTAIFGKRDFDVKMLENFIVQTIPLGFDVHEQPLVNYSKRLKSLKCWDRIPDKLDFYSRGVGSLGGGNHFIEGGLSKTGELVLSVHTGSRNLGLQIAEAHQQIAYEALQMAHGKLEKKDKKDKKDKKEKNRKKKRPPIAGIPYNLAYLEGEAMADYLHDMKVAQAYACLNRKMILYQIATGYFRLSDSEFNGLPMIESVHNYIDMETKIVRKGAISAKSGEIMVIPLNMRDGILICEGKGNADWNESAPHGCGRLYSRTQAKKIFTMEGFKESMEGIYTTTMNRSTLDEIPAAYKPWQEIEEWIQDTAEIVERIRPLFNVKGA
jgi:RNA-splicing ligase RtcB